MENKMEEKQKILITGALGFIGSHLADKLVNLGYEVFGVDNMMYGKKENVNEKVQYLITDNANLLNEEIVSQLSGVKTIFHLGAQSRIQPSFADPPGTAHANGLGTAVVCELARTLGARVVYAGSSTANDDVNLNPYAFWKKVGEGTCQMYSKAFGTSTVIARFYNVYETSRNPDIGPYSPVIGLWQRLYLAGKPITITGLGEQKRDFTSVYDVVDGLILLSQKDYSGEIFHFGTGTSYSLREVAEWFGAGGAPLEFIPARPGEAKATLAQADETLERLGWKPERSVKDYVEKFVKNHSFGSNEIDFE